MLTFLETHRETGHVILRAGLGFTSLFLRGISQLAGGPERWEDMGDLHDVRGLRAEFRQQRHADGSESVRTAMSGLPLLLVRLKPDTTYF